ncbi:SRPBCC family protein [Streptomyces sp. NPDC059740]|uniref:SRPBCC family protein n=1 Tax=Streptomyces sp. NPDC059740 TaxID=3346926 RepID=UPI00365E29CD
MAEQDKGGLLASLKDNPATDRLKEEANAFAAAQAQRLLMLGGQKLGAATARLQEVADGNGPGLGDLVRQGGKKLAEGKGPVRAAVETGAGHLGETLKDKVKGAFGGGGRKGGGGGKKFVTVVEDIDVGVPVREAYDQWTQFQEFSTFTKGVQGVEVADDTTSNWRAKVFWSTRSWKATTTEQVPDERIAWTSEGAKGTTKGVVTFHSLGENLTKVLLVIEYHPKGLFEKTGNIWRAQGRRARLDLKHFRRFLMMRGEATGGWRGEIRDGEVVLSHEDAVEREEAEEREGEQPEGAEAEDEQPEGAEAEDERYEDEESQAGEEDEPETDDDAPEAEADEADDDAPGAEADEADEEEYEAEEDRPGDEPDEEYDEDVEEDARSEAEDGDEPYDEDEESAPRDEEVPEDEAEDEYEEEPVEEEPVGARR